MSESTSRRIRAAGQRLPVVILTARDSVEDTVAGFEGGADDYVTKPFRFEELLARVRARLREERAPAETSIRIGELEAEILAGAGERPPPVVTAEPEQRGERRVEIPADGGKRHVHHRPGFHFREIGDFQRMGD